MCRIPAMGDASTWAALAWFPQGARASSQANCPAVERTQPDTTLRIPRLSRNTFERMGVLDGLSRISISRFYRDRDVFNHLRDEIYRTWLARRDAAENSAFGSGLPAVLPAKNPTRSRFSGAGMYSWISLISAFAWWPPTPTNTCCSEPGKSAIPPAASKMPPLTGWKRCLRGPTENSRYVRNFGD